MVYQASDGEPANLYVKDECGIHHVTLPAVLETPPDRDCFGHLELHEDHLQLVGVDTMMSMKMPFAELPVHIE
eukprot:gene30303-35292_t